MVLHEFWPASVKTVEAMEKWPGSQEPVDTGLSVSLGEKKHLFEVISSKPARAKRFGAAMKGLSEGEGFELSHLVTGYDWGRIDQLENDDKSKGGLVVDIGGSLGFVSTAIAQSFQNLKFVVQDLGRVYKDLDPVSKLPEEMKSRISFMAHDFFEEQPVQADAYLIRWCMHNWSDKYATNILKALVPALKKGARVVINDGLLPEPQALGESWRSSAELTKAAAESSSNGNVKGAREDDEEVNPHWLGEKSMRNMDLIMLEALNARERDVSQWQQLFKDADERFMWKGAWQPKGCEMCIIEAEWSG